MAGRIFVRSLLWLGLLFGMAALPAAAQTSERDAAPVVLDGETLFQVRGIGAYPAEQRAKEVAAKIEAAALDPDFDPAMLRAADRAPFTDVGGGRHLIVRVSDPDAAIEGVSRSLLGPLYAKRIEEAIVDYRATRTRAALGASVT